MPLRKRARIRRATCHLSSWRPGTSRTATALPIPFTASFSNKAFERALSESFDQI